MPLSTVENYNKNDVKWKKKSLGESSTGCL